MEALQSEKLISLKQLVDNNTKLDGRGRLIFDLTVHVRDKRSGKLIDVRPYKETRSRNEEPRFERPPGSGVVFLGNGTLYKHPYLAAQLLDDQYGNLVERAPKKDITQEMMAKVSEQPVPKVEPKKSYEPLMAKKSSGPEIVESKKR